jgi:hypothetical protein
MSRIAPCVGGLSLCEGVKYHVGRGGRHYACY